MKSIVLLTFVLLLNFTQVVAQVADESKMIVLQKYSDTIRFSRIESQRIKYNDSFKIMLNDVLLDIDPIKQDWSAINNTISVLESDDKKMKLLSWVLVNDREEFVNHCVVFYKKKSSAETNVYWLNEKSLAKTDSLYEVYPNDIWPSALYYQMYHFKKKRKDYYCVLGLNGENSAINQKIIDVLWVDKDNEIQIGAPVFYSSDKDYTPQYRVFFEYADQGSMTLRFEKEMKLITFTNLVPSNYEKLGSKQYYIPDGRIDFYRLTKKGKWIKYENLEDFDFNEKKN